MASVLLFSGFDLRAPEIPSDARVLLPPIPLPELDDLSGIADRALEEPVSGEPLSELVRHNTKVTIVVDDPSFSVPLLSRDCRRELLRAVVKVLVTRGLKPNRCQVLVANGLSRKWRSAELADLWGPKAPGPYALSCHDAEATEALTKLGDEPEGPVELARSVAEAEVVIYINVVSMPLHAGLFGLVAGTSGYRTVRAMSSATVFDRDPTPLVPGSLLDRVHQRFGKHLLKRTRVFQVSAVLNNELWSSTIADVLRTEHGLSKPFQVWNALPTAVRHRAARHLRQGSRPIAVFAGSPEAVAGRAREAFYRQHEVTTDGEADIVVLGVPDLGPHSVQSAQNPVLCANLALGYLANLYSERPLLKKGGVFVFANPLAPSFDRRVHLPHEEFYEKVLRVEREPIAIHDLFEPQFAGRPEFVAGYQRRNAFHGAHPLQCWYTCTSARRRAGRVVVAHGDPRVCARFGFTPADNVEDGLLKAREHVGGNPTVAVLEVPPAFWVRVA